jgi:transposase
MRLKAKKYTREFKFKIVREVQAGKSRMQVAREYDIHPNNVDRWLKQYELYGDDAFVGAGYVYPHTTDESIVADMEKKIGQLTMENDLLKKALQQLELMKRRRDN